MALWLVSSRVPSATEALGNVKENFVDEAGGGIGRTLALCPNCSFKKSL